MTTGHTEHALQECGCFYFSFLTQALSFPYPPRTQQIFLMLGALIFSDLSHQLLTAETSTDLSFLYKIPQSGSSPILGPILEFANVSN